MSDTRTSADEMTDERVMNASLVRIVDDDEKMLASYRFMLGAAGWQVKCFSSATAFLADASPQPGCLVLDVRMPDMSGLELYGEMKRQGMSLPVIFVTGHGDVDWCRRDCLARHHELQVNARASDWETLSERERQVAQLVAAGHSNKQISVELAISERTVKFHRASVCQKLGVSGTAQLIARLLELKGKAAQ